MTRYQIAHALEVLSKMVRDGDETTIEIANAEHAIKDLKQLESFEGY